MNEGSSRAPLRLPQNYMPKPTSRRAAMFTWNAGGLTSEIYQELLAWLQLQHIDFAVIQGTRWRGERTWRASGYSIIQSGEPEGRHPVHSGLLTFVADRLCHFDDISYSIIQPGRLMHVKCKIGHNSVDLINVYQHPTSITTTRPKPLAARGDLWTQLDQLLHRLARRNISIVAGDFNCPLTFAGQSTGYAPPDAFDFMEIIKKYHLGTVTPYDARPTYIGPQSSSCIDHILVPKVKLDAHARQGTTLPDFPVASWRVCRDHVPVISSIPLGWRCWYHKPKCTHRLPKAIKLALHDAWKTKSNHWTQLEADLSATIAHVPPNLESLSCLQQTLLQQCNAVLRTTLVPSRPQPPRHRSIMAQLWHLYGTIRNTQTCTLQSLFQVWQSHVRLMQLKRRLSKSCKAAKVHRLQTAVAEAHQAALRQDIRTVFQVIRKLTPKQPFRTIRLRGPQGEALPAFDECKQFEAHFAEVFQSPTSEPVHAMTPIHELPFTFDELVHAFHTAPITKAAGPHSMPHLLLRLLAEPLATWLWPALEQSWCHQSHPTIPQEWRDAWLVLLAKRLVRCPGDVRPIALTDSIGKTVLGLLTHAIKPYIVPQLQQMPMFAFLPARGTHEALLFVCQHCREVRSQCEAAGHTYWRQTHAQPAPPLRGGLMLRLDMSQAFDRLPRNQLSTGFQLLQVPSSLSQFFMHWLDQATYHFDHRRIPCSVVTTQGVRQGCKASPMEWTIFLAVLLTRLNECLSPADLSTWVAKHLITYADDLLARWQFSSKAEVHHILTEIGTILDVLEQLGMRINLKKSVLLMRLSGRQSRSLKKKLVVKQAGMTGLCIPRANGTKTFLPLVTNHVYLGVKIGYHQFEQQTLSYRLHIGHIAFLRLRPWLIQRHAYPLNLRAQLWQTCIRSTCLHGLQATGLPSGGPQRLHRHFLADLRKIARSHSYYTHETTEALLNRLNLPAPAQHLQDLWQQQHERLLLRCQGLPPGDFLLSFDAAAHHAHIMSIFTMQDKPNFDDIQLCPYCDFSCQLATQLKRHLRTTHKSAVQTNQFVPLRDALAGHPQCAHCNTKLATRGGLHRHITKDQCTFFDDTRPLQDCLADLPALREFASKGNWQDLWHHDQLLQQLRQCCSLCGLQYFSRKSMVEHLHRDHGSAWDLAQPHIATLAAQTESNPCAACGHEGKRAHACPVLRQIALIQALHDHKMTAGDLADRLPQAGNQLTSPYKRARPADNRSNREAVAVFQPARDAADGEPQCTHCGLVYKTTYILRRHIEDRP